MKNLILQQTDETPYLEFNKDGHLLIKGISIPENINTFYAEPIRWLNELKAQKPKIITLEFQIEYINTSSTRVFIDIIRLVDSFKDEATQADVVWAHEEDDEDNIELGEELQFSSKVKFTFKVK